MKNIMITPIKMILIILFTFIFSCATTEQTKKEPIEVQKVNFKTYQISAPSSGKWESETKEDEESVKFINKSTSVIPLGPRQKEIRVFKISTSKELQYQSEEVVALGFRDQEERILIKQFKKGNYYAGPLGGWRVSDVSIEKKDVTTIGNKRLYYMKYSVSDWGTSDAYLVQAILYLYVPEDFKDRLAFYGFLHTDSFSGRGAPKINLEEIHWVINSFQLR